MTQYTPNEQAGREAYEDLANKFTVSGEMVRQFTELQNGVFQMEPTDLSELSEEDVRISYAAQKGSQFILAETAATIREALSDAVAAFDTYVNAVSDEYAASIAAFAATGVDVSDITDVTNDDELNAMHERFPELDPKNLTIDDVIDLLRSYFEGTPEDGEEIDLDNLGAAAYEGYPHAD